MQKKDLYNGRAMYYEITNDKKSLDIYLENRLIQGNLCYVCYISLWIEFSGKCEFPVKYTNRCS